MAVNRMHGYAGPACPACNLTLPLDTLVSGHARCRGCGESFEAVRFTPPETRASRPELAGLGPETEAPCARHERNQAVAACDRCGQFMCELCRITSDGRAYCPPCLERLSADDKIESLVTRRVNFNGITLVCMLGSILLCVMPYFSIPIGIVGIVYGIRGIRDLNRRGEEEGHVGLVLMLIVTLLATLGMIGIIGWFIAMVFMGSLDL